MGKAEDKPKSDATYVNQAFRGFHSIEQPRNDHEPVDDHEYEIVEFPTKAYDDYRTNGQPTGEENAVNNDQSLNNDQTSSIKLPVRIPDGESHSSYKSSCCFKSMIVVIVVLSLLLAVSIGLICFKFFKAGEL